MRQIKHNTESVLWEWNYNRSLYQRKPYMGKTSNPARLRLLSAPPPDPRPKNCRDSRSTACTFLLGWGGCGGAGCKLF